MFHDLPKSDGIGFSAPETSGTWRSSREHRPAITRRRQPTTVPQNPACSVRGARCIEWPRLDPCVISRVSRTRDSGLDTARLRGEASPGTGHLLLSGGTRHRACLVNRHPDIGGQTFSAIPETIRLKPYDGLSQPKCTYTKICEQWSRLLCMCRQAEL